MTAKTLRHYDEIGLLKPSFTDEQTGYRYYDSDALSRMHKIRALKQMGFSLSEIMAVIDCARPEKLLSDIIMLKKQELLCSIEQQQEMLQLLENFRQDFYGDFMMNYSAIIKELPKCIVASMRTVIPDYNALFHLAPEVMGPEMQRLGCKCAVPEYCFNIYHQDEYKETDIDVEICEAVEEAKEDSDILKFKMLPKIDTAVCVLHKGPYQKLGEAYSFAFEYMGKNGYKLCGHPRESYIDGIWNKESEEDWLTELQFPVSKA